MDRVPVLPGIEVRIPGLFAGRQHRPAGNARGLKGLCHDELVTRQRKGAEFNIDRVVRSMSSSGINSAVSASLIRLR